MKERMFYWWPEFFVGKINRGGGKGDGYSGGSHSCLGLFTLIESESEKAVICSQIFSISHMTFVFSMKDSSDNAVKLTHRFLQQAHGIYLWISRFHSRWHQCVHVSKQKSVQCTIYSEGFD